MIYVLDANAMIALLRQEAGSEVIRDLLVDPQHTCVAHGVNLCEVLYAFTRAAGQARGRSAIEDLYAAGVGLRDDMDTPFWQKVGRVRAAYGVPFADAFCLALAQRLKATLVTSDHDDFEPIVQLGLCPVQFFR